MTHTVLEHDGQQVARKAAHGGKREGAGRPKSERDDATAKIDKAILARAHFVARVRGISVAEYLSETLRGPVDRDFHKESVKQEGKGREGQP